ncbi:Mpp10 protein [Massarina eburnea CBS 473.64]|uniref:U3 small nucleolar ribonucleoprotein protein MPP10 n=1 Tax=Massarina eburnea CBS 473.64 TaxID=1395130 RepID=A0A6A6RNS3_9PLEO|nr:Mpp10 protein [Massarina eburnea CBS 473.64]
MAPQSFSPDTSISSHTLSAGSAQPPPMELHSTTNAPSNLLASPLVFLQPTKQLNASFLAAAKQFLDPVAAGVSESQSQRQQELRRKRKRGEDYADFRALHLKKVHLQGFGVNQVFEQTRKILDAATKEIELALPEAEDGSTDSEDLERPEEAEEDEDSSDIGEEGADWEHDGEDVSDEEHAQDGEEVPADEQSGDEDLEMEDVEEGMFSEEGSEDDEPAATYISDPNGLNDGFFEIDQFNKATDFLEQQDNRGEAADSDDDEIDWEGNPFAVKLTKNAKAGEDVDMEDEESDEEDGPTFGNMDLNAPEGESEDDDEIEEGDMDGMGMGNANTVFYKDFFAPPAQKAGKNKKKRGRPNPHNFPSAADPQNNKPDEQEVEAAMSRVHRDLFEDDDDVESNGDLSDLEPGDPMSRRSTHERRQAKIADQIRKLEAANVAKREWQLSGEARAADRPMNSLLEEGELDYERAGKPVPVITQEVSEDIEALIKRRILAGEFDEVQRRRPDDLATGPKVRRGQFELEDTKATKGLAEIYEEEHLRATDPNFVDARDEKLKKEHAEISELWKNICGKLDSLSSSHFKPKPATANLEIRVDAPAIEMEDARPTAGGDVATSNMLAPQELYKPGEDKLTNTEIVTKGGLPVARDEMSREEKMRRRRREKERIKKAGLSEEKSKVESGKEKKGKDKKQLIGDLKKGGVQIIGKKGQVTDVEGAQVKEAKRMGAGSYKL